MEGEVKCKWCSKEPDYHSMSYIFDGVKTTKGVCQSCLNKKKSVFFCPKCQDLYKAPVGWGMMHSDDVCRPVVCKKHSLESTTPVVMCVVCGVHATECNTRGAWYCNDCYYQTRPCSAGYCRTALHQSQTNIVKLAVPGKYRLYCEDCALVKTGPSLPVNHFHPLSWDFDPKCWCMVCQHLRGKSNKWSTQIVRPKPDAHCSQCLTAVHSSTLTKAVLNSPQFCHVCAHNLRKCPACKQPRLVSGFHESSLGNKHKLYKACDVCMASGTDMWLCDVGCRRWFKSESECGCDSIFPYNYTPKIPHFLTSLRHPLVDPCKVPFLGFELEVEAQQGKATRKAGAKLVKSLAHKYSYVVHDGTLLGSKEDKTGGQMGFEIVTHPFTFEWFEESWPEIESLLRTLASKGYRSWEGKRCGIHVHISKAPMSRGHQEKFINFVWGSTNLMLCVGQRGYRDVNLNKHSPFHGEHRSKLTQKIMDHCNPGIHGHYTALSTNKPHSIEARWFRGTLNPLRMRKNIELMHSMWYFTKEFGQTSANEINYYHWLRETPQSRRYAVLLDFIERNYVTRR